MSSWKFSWGPWHGGYAVYDPPGGDYYSKPSQPKYVVIDEYADYPDDIADMAERIEGKVGLRKDDVYPEDPAQKKQLHAVTENLVAALTKAALAAAPGEKAKVIDVEPIDKDSKEE